MKNHKNTSGTTQPKGRNITIKAKWFMKPYLVLVGVWEGDIEHAAIVAPVEILEDDEIARTVERLLGGTVVSVIDIPLKKKEG